MFGKAVQDALKTADEGGVGRRWRWGGAVGLGEDGGAVRSGGGGSGGGVEP